MQKTFTKEDFINYFYGEMEQKEEVSFLLFVESNQELKSEFLDMKQAIHLLNSVEYHPSPSSLDLIMEYSSSTANHEEMSK